MHCDEVITIDPEILSGTPVFTGTRVPIHALIDHLNAADSLEDFLEGVSRYHPASGGKVLRTG
jgi:uncharacterized protein (DUF433 family)